MLYALIGNGNPNRKEVIASLSNLREGVYQRSEEEEFWLLLVDYNKSDLSDACSDIVQWSVKKGVPFEAFNSLDGEDYLEWQESADSIYKSTHPTEDALKMVKSIRDAGQEDAAVLLVFDDVYEDETAMDVAWQCSLLDIPVFDLGGQMTQLEIEVVSEDDEESPTEELNNLPVEEDSELIELSRTELEALTLTELKAIVNDSGIVPRDMRSKESLIQAILREEEPASIEKMTIESIKEMVENTEVEVEADKAEVSDKATTKYWLSFIGVDGELKSVPVNSEDADWLLNPEG